MKEKYDQALRLRRIPAMRRWTFVAGAVLLVRLNLSNAAAFPVLDSETHLPGNGPVSVPDNGSVAICGDTALVGNLVYVSTPSGWLFQQVLTGSGTVALSGDTAVVGTNIFARSGTSWELQGTLPFPYGYRSLALDQDLIAIGTAYENVSNVVNVGAVYVFERSNSVWSLQTRLGPGDPKSYIQFGASITLNAGRLLVGAPHAPYPDPGTGSAYVFLRNGNDWVQEAKLTSDASVANFGSAVAMSDETIAVASSDSAMPVTVFIRSSGQWVQQQSLPLPSYWNATYGTPLALRGNTVAISDLDGAVHIFSRTNGVWNERQLLTSGSTNKLGPSIALETNAVIAGTPLLFNFGVADNRGAWIFEPRTWTWQEQDVGDVGAQGRLDASTNVLSVAGAGSDIVDTADAFHFVFRPYSNDLEMIVRVVSVGGSDPWSRGGIMFRSSLDSDAPFVFISQRQGGQTTFQSRSATGANADFLSGPWADAPYWLRLRKLGNNFAASVSPDGSAWIGIIKTNVPLPETFLIGLAVTSHQRGSLATDVFDHVDIAPIALPRAATDLAANADGIDRINLSWKDNSDNESAFVVKLGPYYPIAVLPPNTTNFTHTNLSHNTTYSYTVQAIEPHQFGPDSTTASATTLKLPPPWLDQDIGQVQVPGSAEYSRYVHYSVLDPAGFTVTSCATNNSVAGLHFVYRQWTGDFDFRASPSIGIWTGNAPGAKAGLMIRASLEPTSPYVFACVTETEGERFIATNMAGANTVITSGRWAGEFRIVRRGNTFTVFHQDPTGLALSEMTERTINLPSTIYIGFAVTGQDAGYALVGSFTDIYLAGGVDAHPVSQPMLGAVPLSPSEVKLSWTDANVNRIIYEIFYFSTDDYGYPQYSYVGPSGYAQANSTSIIDNSIIPGMARNYRLRVRLADGDWFWSNFASARTPLPDFNLPKSWQMQRVGSGSIGTATATENNRTFSIWGSGAGLIGASDSCSGTFRQLNGDGSITARFGGAVDTMGNTSPTGKFGIMIRQSLLPEAPAAAIFRTVMPSYYGFGFMSRVSTGWVSQVSNLQSSFQQDWLRLVRVGSQVSGYASSDGVTWTNVGSSAIQLTDPIMLGIFVTDENTNSIVRATFDNLQIAPPQPPFLSLEGIDTNGASRIKIEGAPGWTNRIEFSPDLVHWDIWTNHFNFAGSIEVVDPGARTNSIRFYRASIEY